MASYVQLAYYSGFELRLASAQKQRAYPMLDLLIDIAWSRIAAELCSAEPFLLPRPWSTIAHGAHEA